MGDVRRNPWQWRWQKLKSLLERRQRSYVKQRWRAGQLQAERYSVMEGEAKSTLTDMADIEAQEPPAPADTETE